VQQYGRLLLAASISADRCGQVGQHIEPDRDHAREQARGPAAAVEAHGDPPVVPRRARRSGGSRCSSAASDADGSASPTTTGRRRGELVEGDTKTDDAEATLAIP
jgi:hypothetical protein